MTRFVIAIERLGGAVKAARRIHRIWTGWHYIYPNLTAAQISREYRNIEPERKTTCLRIRYPNLHCQVKTSPALLCATILRRQR